jgi:hypothetical protein
VWPDQIERKQQNDTFGKQRSCKKSHERAKVTTKGESRTTESPIKELPNSRGNYETTRTSLEMRLTFNLPVHANQPLTLQPKKTMIQKRKEQRAPEVPNNQKEVHTSIVFWLDRKVNAYKTKSQTKKLSNSLIAI